MILRRSYVCVLLCYNITYIDRGGKKLGAVGLIVYELT